MRDARMAVHLAALMVELKVVCWAGWMVALLAVSMVEMLAGVRAAQLADW